MKRLSLYESGSFHRLNVSLIKQTPLQLYCRYNSFLREQSYYAVRNLAGNVYVTIWLLRTGLPLPSILQGWLRFSDLPEQPLKQPRMERLIL